MSEESLAEKTRTLLDTCDGGVLATHSIKHPDYPHASAVPFALDAAGSPLVLVSNMATHTKNMLKNPKVSLLATAGTSQADARATLIGNMELVPDAEQKSAMQRYLQRYPDAEQWSTFGDFRLFKLQIVEIYIVAGFGLMGWVKPEEYLRGH